MDHQPQQATGATNSDLDQIKTRLAELASNQVELNQLVDLLRQNVWEILTAPETSPHQPTRESLAKFPVSPQMAQTPLMPPTPPAPQVPNYMVGQIHEHAEKVSDPTRAYKVNPVMAALNPTKTQENMQASRISNLELGQVQAQLAELAVGQAQLSQSTALLWQALQDRQIHTSIGIGRSHGHSKNKEYQVGAHGSPYPNPPIPPPYQSPNLPQHPTSSTTQYSHPSQCSYPNPYCPPNPTPMATQTILYPKMRSLTHIKRPPPPNTKAHKNRDGRPFPPFSMTKSRLLQFLVDQNLATPRPLAPMNPPYPGWYNPNLTCEFHGGTLGHSIDTCTAFRRLVLKLLDTNKITLDQPHMGNDIAGP